MLAVKTNLVRKKIVICSAGNAAHVFACLAAQNPLHEVHIFSMYKKKAERFKIALHDQASNPSGKLVAKFIQEKCELYSNPYNITKDASQCLPNADLVIISLPAIAHEVYLKAIAQFVGDHKCIIAVFPGAGGLESDWKSIILDSCRFSSKYLLLSCNTLPWSCRTKSFGQCVHILGVKEEADVSVHNHANENEKSDCISFLQSIIGEHPKLLDCGNILKVSLGAINAIVHPAILYAKWHDWNEKPVAVQPLFYHGISQAGAEILSKMSEEVRLISQCVDNETGTKLNMLGGYQLFLRYYGNICTDNSSVYSIIRTNPAHNGLLHPMIELQRNNDNNNTGNLLSVKDDNKSDESFSVEPLYVPNFNHRYLTEDIPFGLCVIKGISLLLKGIPITDNIDVVLRWAQKVLNKEYFVYEKNSNKVIGIGVDIGHTRAPQKYGFEDIKQLKF